MKYLNRGRRLLNVQRRSLGPSSERNMTEAGADCASSILMWAINETWWWGDEGSEWTNKEHFSKVFTFMIYNQNSNNLTCSAPTANIDLEEGPFGICSHLICFSNHSSWQELQHFNHSVRATGHAKAREQRHILTCLRLVEKGILQQWVILEWFPLYMLGLHKQQHGNQPIALRVIHRFHLTHKGCNATGCKLTY